MTPLSPAYQGLEPAAVWQHFNALNHIPRPSGEEDAARAYVQQCAVAMGATYQTDARGNICVHLESRGSNIEAPLVTFQSHLDMVCQKRPEVTHDFETDPIVPRRDGDKIFASGTTLGADNGIGAAMMLAVLTSPDVRSGPLELLFTVEEETGLYGAAHLDPDIVQGRLMVNLDSEDPDEITIGCAGGAGIVLFVPTQREAVAADWTTQKIVVGGLKGGHSGVQINEPLANAIQILAAVLTATQNSGLRLVSIEAGTAHNAIPRDAVAIVAVPNDAMDSFQADFAAAAQKSEAHWSADEPGIQIELAPAPGTESPLTADDTAKILDLLPQMPHGVQQMSERFAGKVQTSTNFAAIHTLPGEMELAFSNRSFLASGIETMQNKVADLGHSVGARIEARDGYPGWEPRGDSALSRQTARAFEKVTGRTPKVEVVHAGLECGLLSEKLPGLDAVSFGPLIRGPHTPEEWVSIGSVGETYQILVQLLEDLG